MKYGLQSIVLALSIGAWAAPGWSAVSLYNLGGEASYGIVDARAEVNGVVDTKDALSPNPFGPWVVSRQATVFSPTGFAAASAQLDYAATTSVIRAKGVTGGSGSGTGSRFDSAVLMRTFFNIEDCHHFDLVADIGSSFTHRGYAQVRVYAVVPDSFDYTKMFEHFVNGGEGPSTRQMSGSFSNGLFSVDAESRPTRLGELWVTDQGSFVSPDFDFTITFSPCENPLISQQPQGGSILASSTTSLHVGVTGAAGSFNYQWRRDGQDLVDGAGITGATGPTLTIQSFDVADEGVYSVLVSNGVDSQLSSLVALNLAPAAVPSFGLIPRALASAALLWVGVHAMGRSRRIRSSSRPDGFR